MTPASLIRRSWLQFTAVAVGSLAVGGAVKRAFAERGEQSLEHALSDALRHVPEALRPATLRLRLDAGLGQHALFDARSSTIWVSPSFAQAPAPSVLLHELAHAAANGSRPNSLIAQRLVQAVDEAHADYFAASVLGTPRIGSEELGEVRDLSAEIPRGAVELAQLALPGFSPHEVAAPLACLLWQAQPDAGALLTDLTWALRSGRPWRASTPGAVAQELVARCAERTQPLLQQILMSWLGPQLYPTAELESAGIESAGD